MTGGGRERNGGGRVRSGASLARAVTNTEGVVALGAEAGGVTCAARELWAGGDLSHIVDAHLSALVETLGGNGTSKSEDSEGLHFGGGWRRCSARSWIGYRNAIE